MKTLYTAAATSTGNGRNGHVTSEDDILDLDVRVPKEMGGEGGATNPEELFAVGYSACFHSALKTIAQRAELNTDGSQVTARVDIGKTESGMQLAVRLQVQLPGLDAEQAQDLAEKAHQNCPYSKATRGNIEVTVTVV